MFSLTNGETVTRLRAAQVTDPYSGDTTALDWTSPTTLAITGCAVAPKSSDEPSEVGRTAVITGLTVYAPTGADMTRLDRLLVRGETYEVDGEVGVWASPFTGWAPGLEVNLKRQEG